MIAIHNIHTREIFDSRGIPTLEVSVTLASGAVGTASVPSGASVGSYEAMEKRDGDPTWFRGKGVRQVCHVVNTTVLQALKRSYTQQTLDQHLIDLDGTVQKTQLGGNALLGVSLAFAKAMAVHQQIPLYHYMGQTYTELTGAAPNYVIPTPFVNVLNGGKHAHNQLDIQEFMMVPLVQGTFMEKIHCVYSVIQSLKALLIKNNHHTNTGDEGGFAPPLSRTVEALDLLKQACQDSGFTLGTDVGLALDSAASEFYNDGSYAIDGKRLSSEELVCFYEHLIDSYGLISIEDPFFEDDFAAFAALTQRVGHKCQIVGDDLFTTNVTRIQKGIDEKLATAVLIKPNQIGTLTETLQAIFKSQAAGLKVMISHRSGETEDTTIADLAVGVGAGQIKTGSLCRSDRVAKYNRLLAIEEERAST